MSGDAESVSAGVVEELTAREPLFHRREFGTTRADFEAMMTDDFWEVGASGCCYSRAYVLDVLEERHRHEQDGLWETSGFHCRQLGPAVYLLTYVLVHKERTTRRSTLWDCSTGPWKAIYHQGTVIQTPATPQDAAPRPETSMFE